jgi:hypothetical protein
LSRRSTREAVRRSKAHFIAKPISAGDHEWAKRGERGALLLARSRTIELSMAMNRTGSEVGWAGGCT